jgi:sugar-specific transcriptional regulator TrmB
MAIRDSDIQTIVELGLTLLQAKTYLALSSLGNANIKTISKTTNIAKQDVYRIMPKLQELGLAEKLVAEQAIYRAVPLKDGTLALLQHKTQEYLNLQKKTTDLIDYFKKASFQKPVQEENFEFRIISERDLLYRLLDEKNKMVQKSVDVAGTWKSSQGAFEYERDVFRQAMEKGVRFRWISELHKKDKQTDRLLKPLQMYSLFEIRYVAPPPPLLTAIFDAKEASICVATAPNDEVTSIWSNNPVFVKLVLNYFEEIWNGASINYAEKLVAKPSGKLMQKQVQKLSF